MPVRDNADRLLHSVRQRWAGWGTLAYPGFHNPSWSMGELVQLEDEKVRARLAEIAAAPGQTKVTDYT